MLVLLTCDNLQVGTVILHGARIVSLVIDAKERLCLAQISNTLLKEFSYNEIHNRRVALGITCVQCTPVQLEILRRAGAMPISSRWVQLVVRHVISGVMFQEVWYDYVKRSSEALQEFSGG